VNSNINVIEKIWKDSVERVSKPNTPATGIIERISIPVEVKR
jgi:hypothetical protein